MTHIFSKFAHTDNTPRSMDIEQIISRTYPLPPSSMERMKAYMQEVELPKGHHVLRMGKVEKDIFFIKRGIARAYTIVDGNDITFWIGEEGDTLVSMNGYVNNQLGYESMELMEPSVLYVLKHRDLQRLPLGSIASYLGITQVSLSRIRAKIK